MNKWKKQRINKQIKELKKGLTNERTKKRTNRKRTKKERKQILTN